MFDIASIKNQAVDIKNEFLDMLFPRDIACVICGDDLREDAKNGICNQCYETLPFNNQKSCEVCGQAISDLAKFCNRCQSMRPLFVAARAPFNYDGALPKLIKSFKFGGKRYLAENFAPFMAEKLREFDIKYDIILPVPVHKKTLRRRGFNQAELLACHVAKALNQEEKLVTNCLMKVKYTKEQARLGKVSRAENLEGSFAVIDKSPLKHKVVLLIDDVLTTGATANEVTKTLEKAGAKEVYVLCLASTIFKGE